MIDFFALPEKYQFNNKESLTDGVYIDDNALFVYFCISRGFYDADKDSQVTFLFFCPFEWTMIDYISFLLYVVKSYNLKVSDIETVMGAVKEDYEVSFEPKVYNGAYQWILDLELSNPERDEVVLFDRFLSDTANSLDLERALIYADRIAPLFDKETNEVCLSKEFFGKILDYTHFSILSTPEQVDGLRNDFDSYLNAFMKSNKKPKINMGGI